MHNAFDIYRFLMKSDGTRICELFDTHVLASSFALAIEAAQRSIPLTHSLGLSAEPLKETSAAAFPHATPLIEALAGGPEFVVPEDEAVLRDLLWRGSTGRSRMEARLAAIVARRAQAPNHLWQDLGLRNRRELSWLMECHFAPLATRNAKDMRWKKFLYRTICRDTDMSLCVAPICSECDDYETCFGDEAGTSLLAPRPDQHPVPNA